MATTAASTGASTIVCTVAVNSSENTEDSPATEAYFKALRVVILNSAGNIVFATRGATSSDTCTPIVAGEGDSFALNTTPYADADTFNTVSFKAAVAQSYTLVVWLEGNDPACISANIDTNPDCDISINFEVKDIERQ